MTTILRVELDDEINEQATKVLEVAGLTPAGAARLLLNRIASEKSFPLDLLAPNAETLKALEETRRGDLKTVGGVDELFADLNAPD